LKELDIDMAWFKREIKGIITTTEEKKETPDGIWNKCPECKKPLHYSEQVENQYVCHYCGYHMRIGSKEYFSILFDNNEFVPNGCQPAFQATRCILRIPKNIPTGW
jgi:acetyl-CoA carboxylase carboxyl transferase subunit beta